MVQRIQMSSFCSHVTSVRTYMHSYYMLPLCAFPLSFYYIVARAVEPRCVLNHIKHRCLSLFQ